jgi:GTP cyclohydrolase II
MKPLVKAKLPLSSGMFEVVAFDSGVPEQPHLALTAVGKEGRVPLVRVHSECWTGDVVGSLKCDCGPQLEESLQMVAREGGAVIYLRQEGRGIGLVEKLKAYNLQDQGMDTFEANEALGHSRDGRRFDVAAAMLHELGWTQIRLLTNNPEKVRDLRAEGIDVVEVLALAIPPNEHNRRYLTAKASVKGS